MGQVKLHRSRKRKKICNWLRVTEEELLARRRQTIDSIYKNLNDSTKPGVYKDKDRKGTFEPHLKESMDQCLISRSNI